MKVDLEPIYIKLINNSLVRQQYNYQVSYHRIKEYYLKGILKMMI